MEDLWLRYAQLSEREKQVFDAVLETVGTKVPGVSAVQHSPHAVPRTAMMQKYIEYGQALLAVYRLVKRGIVPDPRIVEYLKDNLDPSVAKQLALQQQVGSPTSSTGGPAGASQGTGGAGSGRVTSSGISSGVGGGMSHDRWTRATLAQRYLKDTSSKYSRLVCLPGETAAHMSYAVRLENLRTLQTILSRKFLKHSLRTPEDVYNFIATNDAVGTLSCIAGNIPKSYRHSASKLMDADRKEDVLVKIRTLMSDKGSTLSANRTMCPPPNYVHHVPLFVSLSNFRKHKFPAGRLQLARTIRLREDVCGNGRHWIDSKQKKRHTFGSIAKEAGTRMTTLEIKKQQEAERAQRERMKALRERNMDAYLALVKNVKNQRIQEILENTEQLLQDIGSKIQTERVQNEARRKREADKDREKKRQRELARLAKKGLTPSSTAVGVASEIEEAEMKPDQEVSDEETETKKPQYLTLSHRVREDVGQPKSLVGGTLMPYQLAGLDFLVSLYNNNLSGILADEMGLGKTIQTISLVAYLQEFKNNKGPHLIAVPLSTLPNWASEFAKWAPSLTLLQYRGNKNDRRELNYQVKRGRYNVLLTTFEYILREKKVLGAVKWRFIIVDEGHKMKNVKSKFHATLGEFKSTHRLLLTGTPLQNNLNELWSLLNFLMPHTFASGEDFERWFEEPFKEQFAEEEVSLTEEEKLVVINRLHLVLRPFLLRRVKADVLTDLPTKREYVIRIALSSWQKFLYYQLVNKCLKVRDQTGRITQKSVANGIMQLRKAVNHPYLFADMYNIDDNLYRVSGKFEVLDRMLPKLLQFGHKILIFSQMTAVMDILGDYFDLRGYKFHRLDGSMIISDRQDRMDDFNDPMSETHIFMLSTRAGGLGLNLQAGDTVILFDSDWNPHADLQAQARAHRVGQKREVRVFRFVTDSPVEELILAKAQHKLSIDEQIIQAGMFSTEFNEEEREEKLRNLLAQKDTSSNTHITTPPELVRFMARNDQEEHAFDAIDREMFGDNIYNQFYEHDDRLDERSESSAAPTASMMPTATTVNPPESASVKESERVRELLEQAGRLCRDEEIPAEVKEINASEPEDHEEVLGVRKSRLRAQQAFLANRVDDDDELADDGEPSGAKRKGDSNHASNKKRKVL
ncbi:DNA helicase [Gregarina niphandrodes]|uniref:DNA helicase n=1 Tax=Gregarina niphandrodes TaxID=110365 RepID=A0A023B9E9_GRENI|nr:DNA helicase [Gregarina niphandrodes]EZG72217.1 DNA helicase [Gregarina niphandrodes]|eukprot:XP_011129793.1 DNA helicase [Gregarina niphandrodes]